MLKRLSYPLSWVEGLTGENAPAGPASQGDSLPTSADSHNSTSMFSKVFNRYTTINQLSLLLLYITVEFFNDTGNMRVQLSASMESNDNNYDFPFFT